MPELVVENPLDARVLLYDGEELVGAKQNRILNVSVLVEAGAKLRDPRLVRRAGPLVGDARAFGSADHVSHAHLRRRKAEALAAQPLARGVAQGEVWDEVREQGSRACGVDSRTARQPRTLRGAPRPRYAGSSTRSRSQPGQCGAVLALGDDLCLDVVSRPDAFARLWPKLRAGYLLDALERLDGRATSRAASTSFVDEVVGGATTRGSPRPASARTCGSAAPASSAPGSSSTASCSSSRRSRATTAASGRSDGSHGRAAAAELKDRPRRRDARPTARRGISRGERSRVGR